MTEKKLIQLIKEKRRKGKILCFAHRGVSSLAKDGSMEAIRLGISLSGVDGVEFDVQETADGYLLIHHNFALKTKQGTKWIKDLTLKGIRTFKDNDETPLLAEGLSLFRSKNKIINIEIKSFGIAKKIIKLCKKINVYNQVVFTSLYEDINNEIKKADPYVARIFGYPRDRGNNLALAAWTQPIVRLVILWIRKRLKYKIKNILKIADTPFVSLYDKVITKEVVDIMHKNKFYCIGANFALYHKVAEGQVIAYLKQMREEDVDVIVTNHPQLLAKV